MHIFYKALYLIIILHLPLHSAVDFQKQLLPILKERCFNCHQKARIVKGKLRKPKGGLRLDNPAEITKAEVLVPGEPENSSLYTLMTLDPDDDDIMPPKGDPLSKEQTELFRQWIREGGSFGNWGKTVPDLTQAQVQVMKRINSTNAVALPMAKGSAALYVNLSSLRKNTRLENIAALLPNIVELDLRDTAVTSLVSLKAAVNLESLSLAGTAVTDDEMKTLASLPKLHKLNITRTQISNAGLNILKKSSSLKELFTAGSKITIKNSTGIRIIGLWNSKKVEEITRVSISDSAEYYPPTAKSAAPPTAGGKSLFDFEDGTLQGWRIVAGKFALALCDKAHFRNRRNVKINKQGKYYLNTLELPGNRGSDSQTGVMESPRFILKSDYLNFLIAGGDHRNTYLALCSDNGTELIKAHGRNGENFQRVNWKTSAWKGRKLFLRMVDKNSGGWGHLCIDDIRMADTPSGKMPRAKPPADTGPQLRQQSDSAIRHRFLACGPVTRLLDEDNKVLFEVKRYARDGYLLPNGHLLLAFANEVIEYDLSRKVIFSWKVGAGNKEISTSQRLDNGHTMIAELGKKPRIIEVTPQGKIAVEIPLQPETGNPHMQTRMARKTPAGTYLVPHLLAFAVKEYDRSGKVIRTLKTDIPELDGRKAKHWPFTAVLLENGNILCGLTYGNRVVEFTPDGKIAWQVSNKDLGENLIKDACGVQRLANGNTVIACYGQRNAAMPRIIEVTPAKKVVWKFYAPGKSNVHHLQILSSNGKTESTQK